MKYYMAPMEGLTGYVYRNAYHKFFSPMDRYFAPFIANKKMSSRERNDILPDHNQGLCLIPQILTNRSADFLAVAKELKNYGYDIIIAATKSDKINRSQIQKHLSVIRKTLGLGPDDVLIPFSGEKKTGVQELWAEIERFLD